MHPGYLVDDPEGYHSELLSDLRTAEDKLDLWLVGGAERFRRDPALCQALLTVANHSDSRRCFLLIEAIMETPAFLIGSSMFCVLKVLSTAAADSLPAARIEPSNGAANNMDSFYLICFTVGLVLSLLSLIGGFGHFHFGRIHVGHTTHGQAAHGGGHRGHGLSSVNGFTITAFLCWFGGAGYLLHRYSGFVAPVILLLSVVSGVAGSGDSVGVAFQAASSARTRPQWRGYRDDWGFGPGERCDSR